MIDGYCVQYDVYKDGNFIVSRIVRFQTKRHADNVLAKWQTAGQRHGWEYRNIIQANVLDWMTGPNKVNHQDHFLHDTHLL